MFCKRTDFHKTALSNPSLNGNRYHILGNSKGCTRKTVFEAICQIEGIDSFIHVKSEQLKRYQAGECFGLPDGYDEIVRTELSIGLEREGQTKEPLASYDFNAYKVLTADEINPKTNRVDISQYQQFQRDSYSSGSTKNLLTINFLQIDLSGQYKSGISVNYKHHGLLSPFKSFQFTKNLICR